jgi:NitT/TauT family transport system substrate-binding protein
MIRRWASIVGWGAVSLGLIACGDDGGATSDTIEVTFQSKWFPQAQFAGYYAAGGHPPDVAASDRVPMTEEMLSFYEAEGLDVTILPGGDVNPSQEVAEDRADFGTDWIANLVAQVEQNDYDLVHLAQVYQRPGFELVALQSSGFTGIEDFQDRSVGVWDFGNEFPAQVCLSQAGLTTSLDEDLPPGQPPDVETVTYAFDPNGVFPEMVDVASAMSYNELNQVVGLGYSLDMLDRFPSADNGCGLLEDFIFARQSLLDDPNFKDSGVSGREVARRFLRATVRAWEWMVAEENRTQARDIVLDFCGDTCSGSMGQSAEDHQSWQVDRVAELVQPGLLEGESMRTVGCLDMDDYNATLSRLQTVGFIREGTGANILRPDVLNEAGISCP